MPSKSSNAEACECGWFSRAAAEPDVPVSFNEEMNEYELVYPGPHGQARMAMYFCPYCGGSAPRSRRASFFTEVTHGELARVRARLDGLHTISDVVAALGPPDLDVADSDGRVLPATETSPQLAEFYRTLVYDHLSETIQLRVMELPNGRAHFAFAGKYVGPPRDPSPVPDSAA